MTQQQESGRIIHHAVLDELAPKKEILFYFNGNAVNAREGDTIASALMASGVYVFNHSYKRHEPRGIFCAIGHCTDCSMRVDGVENVKTCITLVKEGMRVSEN